MNRSDWLEAFRGFCGILPDAVLLLDHDATVLQANPAALRLLEADEDALVGRTLFELAADRAAATEQWERWRSSRPATPGALALRAEGAEPSGGDGPEGRGTDDDPPRTLRVDGGVVVPGHASGSGQPALVLLRLRDRSSATERFRFLQSRIEELNEQIRLRRRAESRLEELLDAEREARQAAAEANRLKDEFLASISHELRTPLNILVGWIDILEDRGPEPELVAEALPAMKNAVRSETELVEDLLDIQRIGIGDLRLELEAVDLDAVVRDVAARFRGAAEAGEVTLDVRVERSRPPVQADRSRVRQIVWNLLSNAVKFTAEGDSIEIRVRRADSFCELVVEDTGRGIPSDLLPFVFDAFRQEKGLPRESHGGAGLGLAIVRRLAEHHGGEATVASDGPGEGTTFTVTLPLAVEEAAEEELSPRERVIDG